LSIFEKFWSTLKFLTKESFTLKKLKNSQEVVAEVNGLLDQQLQLRHKEQEGVTRITSYDWPEDISTVRVEMTRDDIRQLSGRKTLREVFISRICKKFTALDIDVKILPNENLLITKRSEPAHDKIRGIENLRAEINKLRSELEEDGKI
jgi:hypothetical protein